MFKIKKNSSKHVPSKRIEVSNLAEAEAKIYEFVQKGENYRNITKIEFVINGVVKHFNPSQISQIKAKFEAKSGLNHQDPDKAKVFKLFKSGQMTTNVLIETGYSFEFVKKAYDEFLEFEKMVAVPKWFEESVYDLLYDIRICKNWNDVYHGISDAVSSHKELEEHYFNCSRCSDLIPIRGKSLHAAINYLSKNWGHKECFN